MEILLTTILLISGIVALVSGIMNFVYAFLMIRIYLTNSLNATLDIIKVVKPSKITEKSETGERRTQMEKEEISIMEHLLSTIAEIREQKNIFHRMFYGLPQIAFEIANPSDSGQISFFVSMPRKYQELVEKHIHSFYPEAHIERIRDYTIFLPDSYTSASFLKLKKKSSFPIRTYQKMESDPLHNITNALSKLDHVSEGAAIQLIIRPTQFHDTRRKGRDIAQKMQQGKRLEKAQQGLASEIFSEIGKSLGGILVGKNSNEDQNDTQTFNLTPEENEIIKQIETKASKPHFDVNVRLIASAGSKERSETILSHLENAFVQFEDSKLNKFVSQRDKSHNAKKLAFNFIFRNFVSEEKIELDTEEIASIFHLPIPTTETPGINWLRAKSAPPPPNIPKEGLLVGYNDYRGIKTDVRMQVNDRRRHFYVVGQTGTGKSGFLEELAKQDARNKSGFCVIDPHGEFADNVLACVPKERAEDVIYFDPSDTERPFGLNMLEYDENRPEQRTFVINEMIAIFDKLYDLKQTGGPMFEQYMRNAMLLILDSPQTGSTLMEVPRVFRDVNFRKEKLSLCKDPTVIDFWEKEAEKAGGDASMENISPYITSKLTTFISNDMMRPIIAQQKSTINFRQVMDEKKILIINLSKGKIGEINSHLLGMIIVGKLLMAALSRVDTPEEERNDFYLYIDEFQNFVTDSISQILSEARKYRLCLTMAHQFIGQLPENISKAVFGNVGSLFSFRVGAEDAEFLEKQYAPVFNADDLKNLDNFNCLAKLLINNESTRPFNIKTYPPTKGNRELLNAFKDLSRYKFGRSREIVESEIMDRYMRTMKILEADHLQE